MDIYVAIGEGINENGEVEERWVVFCHEDEDFIKEKVTQMQLEADQLVQARDSLKVSAEDLYVLASEAYDILLEEHTEHHRYNYAVHHSVYV